MRKLVASFFMTLDGVIEAPGPGDPAAFAGWTMPYWDDEIGAFIGAGMAASDTLLLGRVTYEGFAAAFGAGTGPDAERMSAFPKYVVSTTLQEAGWVNTTLITGSVAEAVAKLKQQDGRDIAISGSGTLVQSLLQHNLVDQLNLLIYPVVIGRGKRLFDGVNRLTLQLAHAQTSASGVVLLTYRLADRA